MARLFVAAWPPPSVGDALARLVGGGGTDPGVRLTPPRNHHVTLRFIGDAAVDEVTARLAAATLPAPEVALGPAIERLTPRVLVVPVAGADRLAAACRAALGTVGEVDRHRFRGHLTVARTEPDARVRLLGRPFAARFAVHEIALVASVMGQDGPSYTTVATFPTGVGDGVRRGG